MYYNSCRSLGLAIPPRIRFLQRMQKKTASNDISSTEVINKISNISENYDKQEDDEDDKSDESNISKINKNKKVFKDDTLQFGKKMK